MSITQKPYGSLPTGEAVTEYTITTPSGSGVSIIDFGATITRIVVPDRDGKLDDVNLSVDDVALYQQGKCGSMGAVIGRVGNRIANAEFTLEGKQYTLGQNNGVNNLHGGPKGFNVRMWKAEPVCVNGGDALKLTLTSPDGDQNFPGEVCVEVIYTFSAQNELGITYSAKTSRTTLLNLTNHAYFNLDGHASGSIENQELQVFANCITEVREGLIPTGRLAPTANKPYDFSKPVRLGDVLSHAETDPDMKPAGGVDFNYCMGSDRESKVCAVLYSPKTGREMTVETDLPGVQVYTGQGLNVTGKDGTAYTRFGGICLETQRYPDAIHHPHFPGIVVRPQENYFTSTVYRFGVR